MNKKIIHVVLGKANTDRMNGVNKVVHQLATEMVKQGVNVEVWGITPNAENKFDQRLYKLSLFKGNGKQFWMNRPLRHAIKKLSNDYIFHFHGGLVPQFYSLSKQLKAKNVKWVLTPHGALLKESLKKKYCLKKIYISIFEKYILKNAINIQAITQQEKDEIGSIDQNLRISVVSNGHPCKEIFYNNTENKNEFTLGFIGRLDKIHKGLDIMIEGFQLFYNSHKEGRLIIVGDGKDKKDLVQKVKDLSLQKQILFLGPQFGSMKMNTLKNFDCFIHTSRWDVIPTSILEAAWSNKPLIVSNETGFTNEVFNWYNTGIVLDQNNPQSLYKALQKCYDDYIQGNTIYESRKMIMNEFNWQKIVPQILLLYKND